MSAFDQMIGYESIKAELKRVSDVLKNPERYRKLGVNTPRGVLLYGEPGLGKTMMAKCIIEESGREAFIIRKDLPDGEFIKTIKETFDKAKKAAPSIILFDDMDKYANEDYQHKDAEEYVAIQSGIDSVKDSEVFVIATVNDEYNLPDSMLRPGRFDIRIEMTIPEIKDTEKIIEFYLSKKKYVESMDYEEIASLLEGNTCAELEHVINDAAIIAGYEGKDTIEQEDVVKACLRVIYKAPECLDGTRENYARIIAIHEAGHAVVHEILEPGSVSLVSICRYEGKSEGITKVRKPDGYGYMKKHTEHMIISDLGGKAATEVLRCDTDLGSYCDIETATSSIYKLKQLERFDIDTYISNGTSEALKTRRENMLAQELERYYQMAKKIIINNRDFFDAVVEELIEKKTLRKKDIQKIKQTMLSVTDDLI
ncbi:MAG: AAA family ATPase [Lachnospiraceae bacterium]|nr:AAA family ATPase [Lachnospiraceae bacterium]